MSNSTENSSDIDSSQSPGSSLALTGVSGDEIRGHPLNLLLEPQSPSPGQQPLFAFRDLTTTNPPILSTVTLKPVESRRPSDVEGQLHPISCMLSLPIARQQIAAPLSTCNWTTTNGHTCINCFLNNREVTEIDPSTALKCQFKGRNFTCFVDIIPEPALDQPPVSVIYYTESHCDYEEGQIIPNKCHDCRRSRHGKRRPVNIPSEQLTSTNGPTPYGGRGENARSRPHPYSRVNFSHC